MLQFRASSLFALALFCFTSVTVASPLSVIGPDSASSAKKPVLREAFDTRDVASLGIRADDPDAEENIDPNDTFKLYDAKLSGKWGYECDYTQTFQTLDAITVGSSAMDSACASFHALRTLIAMLDTAMDRYNSVNDHYDEQFKYYKDYIREAVPSILMSLMYEVTKDGLGNDVKKDGPALKFFDCEIPGKAKSACTKLALSLADMGKPVTYYIRDRDGFYQMAAEHGIAQDWIVWGSSKLLITHVSTAKLPPTTTTYNFAGFPVRNDSMVVADPKQIVTPALQTASDLRLDMLATSIEMMVGQWSVSASTNPAQVYSIPVFLIMQGVENMNDAKEAGKKAKEAEDKAKEEQKKNLILMILSVIFMFIPMVGPELAAAAGLANLARTIAIIGELGNAALGIYDTVKDPKMAAVNIVGALFGLGSIAKTARSEKGLGDLAKLRAGMKLETLAKFGKVVGNNEKVLQSVIAVCKKTKFA